METVRDDMIKTITEGSKVAIAASCFSMYAYKELKILVKSYIIVHIVIVYPEQGSALF